MTVATLALLAALQPGSVPQQQPDPSPIARVEVTPADPVVTAGDTLRLRARALDAQGRPVPGARVRFQSAGGSFESSVDTTGLVEAGATGTIPVSAIAFVPGRGQPVVQRMQVRIVPGPAARVVVAPRPARMVAGQRMRLGAQVFSALGDVRTDGVRWTSSAPGVVRVSEGGLLTAVAPGRATVTATAGAATDAHEVEVLADAIASFTLEPGEPRARTGDVIRFRAVARDAQGREIAGLTPTFSFSPGQGMITPDGAFVGYDAGAYTVTATLGGRSADAVVTLARRNVSLPVTVVGRLPRERFRTEEVWVHPDGRHLYLGSGGGGDVLYAVDVSDPANPVVTDSLVANTRRVNDVMTTPDGRWLVHTRENASDRRNGIVIASLEDPARPKVVAEFTDGVTAGVHSAFIHHQPRFGTHVYLTNNGTGALHIVDITDPTRPREAARWTTPRSEAGRSLHDVDVQDGLAYLSYWNDGLVILDVGNGIRGGSPTDPQLVSQLTYDLNELYRDVERVGGTGFIRGTHTAWRHRNYVFIADEVFPSNDVAGARDAAAERAYGRLHVVDVTDLAKPRIVAWYDPEHGGAHNVWAEGDRLYLGAYNAGFRVFDVSGELLGDLRAQGREIAHLNTADLRGFVRNSAMTWGVVVKNGLAYVNDNNNGLWIVRIEDRPAYEAPSAGGR